MRASLEALNRLTTTTARAETLEEIYAAALDAVATTLGAGRGAGCLINIARRRKDTAPGPLTQPRPNRFSSMTRERMRVWGASDR